MFTCVSQCLLTAGTYTPHTAGSHRTCLTWPHIACYKAWVSASLALAGVRGFALAPGTWHVLDFSGTQMKKQLRASDRSPKSSIMGWCPVEWRAPSFRQTSAEGCFRHLLSVNTCPTRGYSLTSPSSGGWAQRNNQHTTNRRCLLDSPNIGYWRKCETLSPQYHSLYCF